MNPVLHTQRFEVVGRLGAGSSGVVYEACNRKSGERVALKALSRLDASSLYRFKREFRALAGVSHPNLVTLNELFHEAGHWYLSMELVRGQQFLQYVRGSAGELDLGRLRAALAQLVRAVYALHQAGRLHRDLKPSNVLVTEQGRVVVLDFGFVRELDRDLIEETAEILGTPAYMAPEQAGGAGAEAASDWYAIGVMLFEALCGRLPFEGQHTSVLLEKLQRPAPRVREFSPAAPADLEQLCGELLEREPSKRPLGATLVERVGAVVDGARTPLPKRELFVGRAVALAQLRAAFERALSEQQPRVVSVVGDSAVGKSALLERLAAELSESGAWVLYGRCHERENVPYKALDGVIDALVRRMSELSEVQLAQLLPRHLGALTLQFPVLLRMPAIAEQSARYTRPADPHELRRQAATALQELFARIADQRALVLIIDDLQWGDVDSVQLLRETLRPEDMPGVLLITASRGDEREPSAALLAFRATARALRRNGRIETLRLEPLDEHEATELAEQLLGERAHERELVRHLVRESERVPLFIHELARHVSAGGSPEATLEQLVKQSVSGLSSAARTLIRLVAIASAPLPMAVARELVDPAELEPLVRELLHQRLVQLAFYPSESLDTRHDQIRHIVQRSLSPEQRCELHFALARHLAAHGAGPEVLAHHFLSAGDRAHAASYAARAAEAASDALAFSSAARCYELALSWGKFSRADRCELMVRLAEALANAGRGREAGEAYLRASELASSVERPALRTRAVDQLLRAGCIEEGVALGDELLRELGLGGAQTGPRALVGLLVRRSLLWLRGYEFVPRTEARVEPRALTRVEAARALCHGLGHMDPFAAANMQARHLMLALESGDPLSVARALGYEAIYLGIEGAAQSEKALALLARQGRLLPEQPPPYLRAISHYSRGVVEWGRGHWREGLTALDRAETGYRHDCIGAAWEILASQLLSLGCLTFMGSYDELGRRVLGIASEAQARDDRLTLQWVLAWQSVVELLRGDVAAAKQALLGARGRLPQHLYTLPHLFALYASTFASLYIGDGVGAHDRIVREWPAIKASQLLRLQVYRVETLRLRAASALCAARVSSSPRALHRDVEGSIARIDAEDTPWAQAVALALRGELHLQQGSPEQALASWTHAEQRLRAANMEGFATATQRCRGLLMGGQEGRELVRLADLRAAQERVGSPERVTGIVLGSCQL